MSTPTLDGSPGTDATENRVVDAGEQHADDAAASDATDSAANPSPGDDASAPEPNESFASARPLSDGSALVDIVHGDQRNYFTLDVAAGDRYALHTKRGDFSPDVVISIYDAAQRRIAQNDDGSLWPGDAVDARVVTEFAAAGRYYVEVYDPSTPAGYFEQSGFHLRYYTLHAQKLETGTTGFARAESSGALPFVMDEASGYRYLTLVGSLDMGAELVTALDSVGDDALIAHVHGAGSRGNGSACAARSVRLETAAGELLGEVRGGEDTRPLYPPLRAGAHRLRTRAPDDCSSGFFGIDLVLLPDNPRELHEADNGTLATAEPIAMKGAVYQRGLLLADLAPGDVDYFSFAGLAGGITTSCEGESAGSGIRALRAELRDGRDAVLAEASSSPYGTLDIDGYMLPADGPVALRLSVDAQVATPLGEPWVRCVVLTAPQ